MTKPQYKPSITRESLVPLSSYYCLLQYDTGNFPGATKEGYLDSRALEILDAAAKLIVNASTSEKQYDLLIWDAYRTKETQAEIYNRYANEIASSKNISFEEAYPMALTFVNSPDGVFPHGTGGTVDLTLLINGEVADMGTEFDEFNEKSHKDWYRKNTPQTEAEKEAADNREVLRFAMESAGFIGLDSEWWHYEWGTSLWAEVTGKPVVLTRTHDTYSNPKVTPAYKSHAVHNTQPALYGGVAQIFQTSDDRSEALLGLTDNHYYSRKSHPTLDGLSSLLSDNITKAKYCSLVTSGINAARTALTSIVPKEGVVICDRRMYYEIGNELLRLSQESGWEVHYTDCTDIVKVQALIEQISSNGKKPDVIYFDSPMNWWLDTVDIQSIARIAKQFDVITIADITLQPLQEGILNYIDVVVVSLSKYPSVGMTLGGTLLTNREDLFGKIEQIISRTGSRMSADTAMTIWSQAITLNDRLYALGHKTAEIVKAIEHHKLLKNVRYSKTDGRYGRASGVIVLEFHNQEYASLLERVVSQNSGHKMKSLNLAFTFGGAMTTLEHFHSNPRPAPLNPGLDTVPDTLVRIGVGYERTYEIIDNLLTALNCVESIAPKYKMSPHEKHA